MVLDSDIFFPWLKLWCLDYLDAALVIIKNFSFIPRQGKVKD